MKNKTKALITAGIIASALLVGTIIYKFDDIKREYRYRKLWNEHNF